MKKDALVLFGTLLGVACPLSIALLATIPLIAHAGDYSDQIAARCEPGTARIDHDKFSCTVVAAPAPSHVSQSYRDPATGITPICDNNSGSIAACRYGSQGGERR